MSNPFDAVDLSFPIDKFVRPEETISIRPTGALPGRDLANSRENLLRSYRAYTLENAITAVTQARIIGLAAHCQSLDDMKRQLLRLLEEV